MSRKFYFSFILVTVFVVLGNISSFAQSAPVTGTVELQKADGTREPVAGAIIEVYRTDIKTGFPSSKSGKKGDFAFAGLALGATYTFAISAPGCTPRSFSGIRAGQDKLVFTLSPGDGSKLSEAEARATNRGAKTGSGDTPQAEQTEEQKKAQAEFAAKSAEITAKNEKIQKSGEIVNRVLKEGNDAYAAKNYDLAVAKYSEGVAALPDFVGSAPVLLNNKGTALNGRAVDTYNKNLKTTDVSAKVEAYNSIRKDFIEAAAAFSRSFEIIKNASAADITDAAATQSNKVGATRGIIETFRLVALTGQVDPSIIEAAKIMIPEYMIIETDPAKKIAANLSVANMYMISGDYETGATSYKKVLETDPKNIDAMWGAGICLITLAAVNNNTDKAMIQEGVNLYQQFVDAAPDSVKKTEAIEQIESLKREQKVAPVKGGGKKKP